MCSNTLTLQEGIRTTKGVIASRAYSWECADLAPSMLQAGRALITMQPPVCFVQVG